MAYLEIYIVNFSENYTYIVFCGTQSGADPEFEFRGAGVNWIKCRAKQGKKYYGMKLVVVNFLFLPI